MKKRSCGFLLEYEGKYLLVKSSGGNIWGIPKGVKEEGETDIETAIRELKEETGMDLASVKEDCGLKPFMEYSSKRKQFVVFRVVILDSEFRKTLNCSTFLDNGKPEVDAFAWVDKQSAINLTKRNHTQQIFEEV